MKGLQHILDKGFVNLIDFVVREIPFKGAIRELQRHAFFPLWDGFAFVDIKYCYVFN